MAIRCGLCSKGKIYGLSHRHHRGVAGGQWKKRAPKTAKTNFPNLHTYRGSIAGIKGVWHLCTKCQRLIKQEAKDILAKVEIKKLAVKEIAPAKKSSKVVAVV
jgi:ribosomal protein L28